MTTWNLSILRPDLESSYHFAYFMHAFGMIYTFWFFDLPCIFRNLKLNSRPLKVLEIDFFVHHRTQRVWNHGKPLDLLAISKVGVFWTTLLLIDDGCSKDNLAVVWKRLLEFSFCLTIIFFEKMVIISETNHYFL